MNCKKCGLEEALEKMKKGDWGGLAKALEFFAEDAEKSRLGPRGVEYVKSVLTIARDYLDANKGQPEEDLTKLDGVDAIIGAFAYYTDMGTFAKGLPVKDLSARIGYIMDVVQCKKGSVARLSRNELHALMYGISHRQISLENRSLNGDIVMKLIEKEVFTRQQILNAMIGAKMIAESSKETVIEVVKIISVPSFLDPNAIIEILEASGII